MMGPRGSNGGNEMHSVFFIWAKVTQVSDVAHGPLVGCSDRYELCCTILYCHFCHDLTISFKGVRMLNIMLDVCEQLIFLSFIYRNCQKYM
jgi:hypothetical protein